MSKLEVSNDKLQQLEAFDFSSDEKFEITNNYDVVTSYKIARENVLQQEFEIYSLNRRDSHYNYSIELEIPDFDLKFDLVIHAAGKAHLVPTTIEDIPKAFDFLSAVSV
jgi:hypothetical protein